MDLGIAGKRALVLGASRGLGAACARALLAEGVEVHGVSRSGTVVDPAMTAIAADLSQREGVERVIRAVAALPRIDILVANTGGPRPGSIRGVGATEWRASFEAMAIALFSIADAVLPGMIAAGWGRIVTIGSSSIEQPIPGLAISNTVRSAIAGWSKTLASEVAPHGVTVNMVLPGRIDTDRVRELDDARAQASGAPVAEVREQIMRDIPAARYGRPEEFGAVVAFVASAHASYATGSMLRVDGGLIRSV
ncbi:MAG: SDR family oxidoreductase [Sphingomonadales bacterium]|nr:SDR family oxidoreductase [Sphingomonadales bacterium]